MSLCEYSFSLFYFRLSNVHVRFKQRMGNLLCKTDLFTVICFDKQRRTSSAPDHGSHYWSKLCQMSLVPQGLEKTNIISREPFHVLFKLYLVAWQLYWPSYFLLYMCLKTVWFKIQRFQISVEWCFHVLPQYKTHLSNVSRKALKSVWQGCTALNNAVSYPPVKLTAYFRTPQKNEKR